MQFWPGCRLYYLRLKIPSSEVLRRVVRRKCTGVHEELTGGNGFPETPVNLHQTEQRCDNLHIYHQDNLISSVLMFLNPSSNIIG
jgi:hypothetical protein